MMAASTALLTTLNNRAATFRKLDGSLVRGQIRHNVPGDVLWLEVDDGVFEPLAYEDVKAVRIHLNEDLFERKWRA